MSTDNTLYTLNHNNTIVVTQGITPTTFNLDAFINYMYMTTGHHFQRALLIMSPYTPLLFLEYADQIGVEAGLINDDLYYEEDGQVLKIRKLNEDDKRILSGMLNNKLTINPYLHKLLPFEKKHVACCNNSPPSISNVCKFCQKTIEDGDSQMDYQINGEWKTSCHSCRFVAKKEIKNEKNKKLEFKTNNNNNTVTTTNNTTIQSFQDMIGPNIDILEITHILKDLMFNNDKDITVFTFHATKDHKLAVLIALRNKDSNIVNVISTTKQKLLKAFSMTDATLDSFEILFMNNVLSDCFKAMAIKDKDGVKEVSKEAINTLKNLTFSNNKRICGWYITEDNKLAVQVATSDENTDLTEIKQKLVQVFAATESNFEIHILIKPVEQLENDIPDLDWKEFLDTTFFYDKQWKDYQLAIKDGQIQEILLRGSNPKVTGCEIYTFAKKRLCSKSDLINSLKQLHTDQKENEEKILIQDSVMLDDLESIFSKHFEHKELAVCAGVVIALDESTKVNTIVDSMHHGLVSLLTTVRRLHTITKTENNNNTTTTISPANRLKTLKRTYNSMLNELEEHKMKMERLEEEIEPMDSEIKNMEMLASYKKIKRVYPSFDFSTENICHICRGSSFHKKKSSPSYKCAKGHTWDYCYYDDDNDYIRVSYKDEGEYDYDAEDVY